MTKDKIKLTKNLELIKNNLNLSATKLYELSKSKGIGIRKQDFLKLVRESKGKSEPTLEKKLKSVPKKYESAKVKTKSKTAVVPLKYGDIHQKTEYGLIEVQAYDDKGNLVHNESFWIKYKSKKDYNRQLDAILRSEYYDISNYVEINHGKKPYLEFVSNEFKSLINSAGVSL